MYLVKVSNNEVIDPIIYVIASVFPNTPNPTIEQVREKGFEFFEWGERPPETLDYFIGAGAFIRKDENTWTKEIVFHYYTDDQKAQNLACLIDSITQQRLEFLRLSDWTQLADVPLSAEKKAEWNTYRQALRDITLQEGYPYNVVFPTEPV